MSCLTTAVARDPPRDRATSGRRGSVPVATAPLLLTAEAAPLRDRLADVCRELLESTPVQSFLFYSNATAGVCACRKP